MNRERHFAAKIEADRRMKLVRQVRHFAARIVAEPALRRLKGGRKSRSTDRSRQAIFDPTRAAERTAIEIS
jgi:hypothetical protein